MRDATQRAQGRARPSAEAEALVVEVIHKHADALLRVARRYSFCADDAHDAYQRSLEIFLRHGGELDPAVAHKWLFTVVRNEAHRVREQRKRLLGHDPVDPDAVEAREEPSPEDSVLAYDSIARSAEALQRLKPNEAKALWMRASGRSYSEIAAECGWSYTKVNRCISEGRRSFLRHYSTIEAGEECVRWAPALSALADGEATAAQLAELRPHLRNCAACRADLRALHGGDSAIAAVLPVGLVAAGAGSRGPLTWLSSLYERLAGSVLKLQAAAEVVSTGKVAAVAASAAALAGGGIVAVQSAEPDAAPPAPAKSAGRVLHRQAPPAEPVHTLPSRTPPAPPAEAPAKPRAKPRQPQTREFSDIEVRTTPAPPPHHAAPPSGSSAVREFAP